MWVDASESWKVDLARRLCGWKKFSPILGGQALGLRSEFRLRELVERRRRSGPRGDERPDLQEKLFLTGGRADAKQSRRLWRRVSKLMWSVGRDVNGCRGSDDLFYPAKCGLYLALKHGEGFFEVMAMRRGASTWRDVHID